MIVATPSSDFKPSRRVRTVPGGPHSDIFGVDAEDDALSTAPPREKEPEAAVVPGAVVRLSMSIFLYIDLGLAA